MSTKKDDSKNTAVAVRDLQSKINECMELLRMENPEGLDDEQKGRISLIIFEQCGRIDELYRDMLMRGEMEELYSVNRMIRRYAKDFEQHSSKQKDSYLYKIGLFNGMYSAYSGMVPKQNEEQMFNTRMSEIIGRLYVKGVIKYLYRNGRTQNKKLSTELNISASQLNRVTGLLSQVGCINRYGYSKYVFFSLTELGQKYVKSILGFTEPEPVEGDLLITSYYKPRIENETEANLSEDYSDFSEDEESLTFCGYKYLESRF